LENLKQKDYSENLHVDGRIILNIIIRKEGGRMWTAVMWLRTRTCEHYNEPSSSIKGKEFVG
jgi:hypothetical protein